MRAPTDKTTENGLRRAEFDSDLWVPKGVRTTADQAQPNAVRYARQPLARSPLPSPVLQDAPLRLRPRQYRSDRVVRREGVRLSIQVLGYAGTSACWNDVNLIITREFANAGTSLPGVDRLDDPDRRHIGLAHPVPEQHTGKVAVVLMRRPD